MGLFALFVPLLLLFSPAVIAQRDLYGVLGVRRSASEDEIKRAFRKKARVLHPDVSKLDKETAERQFQALNRAYETLSDPQKRRLYDLGGLDGDEQAQRQREEEAFRRQYGGGPGGRGFHHFYQQHRHRSNYNRDPFAAFFEHFFSASSSSADGSEGTTDGSSSWLLPFLMSNPLAMLLSVVILAQIVTFILDRLFTNSSQQQQQRRQRHAQSSTQDPRKPQTPKRSAHKDGEQDGQSSNSAASGSDSSTGSRNVFSTDGDGGPSQVSVRHPLEKALLSFSGDHSASLALALAKPLAPDAVEEAAASFASAANNKSSSLLWLLLLPPTDKLLDTTGISARDATAAVLLANCLSALKQADLGSSCGSGSDSGNGLALFWVSEASAPLSASLSSATAALKDKDRSERRLLELHRKASRALTKMVATLTLQPSNPSSEVEGEEGHHDGEQKVNNGDGEKAGPNRRRLPMMVARLVVVSINPSSSSCRAAVFPRQITLSGENERGREGKEQEQKEAEGGLRESLSGWCSSLMQGNVLLKPAPDSLFDALMT